MTTITFWSLGGSRDAAAAASLRPGKKGQGDRHVWSMEPYDDLMMESASCVSAPSMNVARDGVLLMNVELDADSQIPFTALDALRTEYAIDVTAIPLSVTHRGNVYRAHVLQNPGI